MSKDKDDPEQSAVLNALMGVRGDLSLISLWLFLIFLQGCEGCINR